KIRREIGFGVEEQRSDVVLECAFASALIVDEMRFAVAQQNVAGLKVAVEEKIAWRAEQEFGEAAKVGFESVFVEGNAREAQKVVLEIVQVPGDGLLIEAGGGVALRIVEVAAGFDLETRENGDDFAVGVDHGFGDALALAVLPKKFEKCRVAQVL